MKESGCSMMCPKRFHNFAFSPSVGASGGILVVWNSPVFKGTLIQVKIFDVVIEFESTHSDKKYSAFYVWTLSGRLEG
jgi:hypothetical protein